MKCNFSIQGQACSGNLDECAISQQHTLCNGEEGRQKSCPHWNTPLAAPHIYLKPKLYIDGNMWCALYGDDIQTGLSGWGVSPEKAMLDFDKTFRKETKYMGPAP